MSRLLLLLGMVFPMEVLALSPVAQEFMAISQELEPLLKRSPDPEDLPAISLQQREAFYRCE